MTTEEKEAIEVLVDVFRNKLIAARDKAETEVIVGQNSVEIFTSYLNVVSNYFCVPLEEMRSNKSRQTEYKRGRQIAWYLSKTGDTTLPLVLKRLGAIMDESKPFDHTTVLHGKRTIADVIESDVETQHDVRRIANNLGFDLVKGEKGYTIKRIELN